MAKNTHLGEAGMREVARIKNTPWPDDFRYESTYAYIHAAIIGERWVDTGGFNVSKSTMIRKYDCWDSVAQEPDQIQQDHFLRQYQDNGAQGGIEAAKRAQLRFIDHFVNAAIAAEQNIKVRDGGGNTGTVNVDLNYFLFGRAAHLFQDAFSPEHTVRIEDDKFERIRQVKSYLCATGSEQHSHSKSEVIKDSTIDTEAKAQGQQSSPLRVLLIMVFSPLF